MWNSRVRPGIGIVGWLVSVWLTVTDTVSATLATDTVSATLANIILTTMALVSLWTFWPWLKRWRPWTLAPANGEGRSATPDPVLAKLRGRNEQLEQLNKNLEVERDQLFEVLQNAKRENANLKQELEVLRAGERQQRIENWRSVIRDFDFETYRFAGTDTYAQMKSYLKPEVVKMFETPRAVHIGNEARGDTAYRYTLLDEIARIERERGLI